MLVKLGLSGTRSLFVVVATVAACFALFWTRTARAEVLIVAPHPDDDVLTASGITLRASQAGEVVRVVFMTNGDSSGLSAGLNRQSEATTAESMLGTPENRLVFLGYPDGSLEQLRTTVTGVGDSFTGNSGYNHTYGSRGLGGMDYHRYLTGASALNNGANVTSDLASVLSTYRPDHIFVTSEFDQHSDHAATFKFLKAALSAVVAQTPTYNPTVHSTVVWNNLQNTGEWPSLSSPIAYFPEPPGLAQRSGLNWAKRESLDLPAVAQSTDYTLNLKYRAIASHQSQGGMSNDAYISRFLHKEEFFWSQRAQGSDLPPVPSAGSDLVANPGQVITLNAAASYDPDNTALTYAWRQVGGSSVTLSSSSAAQPTFTVPTSAAFGAQLAFEVKVSDGTSTSIADGVLVQVTRATVAGENLARAAFATASSFGEGQPPDRAVDGVASGYPADAAREWSSNSQGVGAWLQLTWATSQLIDRVVLYDRPNGNDNARAGTLTFSDGSSVNVGALDDEGAATTVSFAQRSVTWLRYTVTSVSGATQNVGLAELEARLAGASGGNQAPTAVAGAAQTVAGASVVTLSGTGSSDPEGAALTYAWSQTSGPSVVLSNAAAASPTFTAPPATTQQQVLTFQLIVNDATIASQPATTTITVPATGGTTPPPASDNLAISAVASASSQSPGQEASKANDGVASGYPDDYTREWASQGERSGAWLQLTWPSAQTVNSVSLYDRPNWNDEVLSGVLSFSDGTTVAVGALDNAGDATTLTFPARSTTFVRFTINSVSGATQNVGLAEFKVFSSSGGGGTGTPPPPQNLAPTAVVGANQTVNGGATVTLSGSGSSDPEGAALTYTWTQLAGPPVLTVTNVANPTFKAPASQISNQLLTFELVVSDGTRASAAATTQVTVRGIGKAGNKAYTATATASSQKTGQEARKAIDAVIAGAPATPTAEWSSSNQRIGAWIQLNWTASQSISRVVLYDRPNTTDNITGGILTFSNGLAVVVGSLNSSGGPTTVSFSTRNVTWVRFTVTTTSLLTGSAGLAEFEVY